MLSVFSTPARSCVSPGALLRAQRSAASTQSQQGRAVYEADELPLGHQLRGAVHHLGQEGGALVGCVREVRVVVADRVVCDLHTCTASDRCKS